MCFRLLHFNVPLARSSRRVSYCQGRGELQISASLLPLRLVHREIVTAKNHHKTHACPSTR